MQKARNKGRVKGTKIDRLFSSEDIALQLFDSVSQHSMPGQPATPDQVLPFQNALSLHSSDAAALWPVDSKDMSASPAKLSQPAEQHTGTFSTPSDKLQKPKPSRKRQHTKAANSRKRRLADMYPEQHQGEMPQMSIDHHQRSKAAPHRLQPETRECQDGPRNAAGRLGNQAQTSAHDAAQTEISQSAEDDVMHCCDSMASALAPLMQAHVRSKPGLPAEVTDDSEALSNSASDKVHPSLKVP